MASKKLKHSAKVVQKVTKFVNKQVKDSDVDEPIREAARRINPLKTATGLAILEANRAPASIEMIEGGLFKLFEAFANSITTIRDDQLPQAVQLCKTVASLTDDAEMVIKQKVVALLETRGTVATEAGTRRLPVSGYVLEIQPSATGYDDKKVEALLRAKTIDVNVHMDAVVTYKTNEGKLATMVQLKVLTQDELNTCKKTPGWKMMSPKKEK